MGFDIRKNIFACLFSVHNIISLLSHEQVCSLLRVRFERNFSHHRACDVEASLQTQPQFNKLVHDITNLLYYKVLILSIFDSRKILKSEHI